MTIDYAFDIDTFGLAFFWNAPLQGQNVHPALATHRITIVFLNFVVGIEWKGK